MKTIEEFLSYLCSLDIKLWTEGDRLRCSAPKDALTPVLKTELAERKEEIIDFLRINNVSLINNSQSISPVLRQENLPLSFAQGRLWFIDQLQTDSHFYNIFTALSLKGSLNVAALEYTLNEIVRRHEVLRTTFASQQGQPIQVIRPTLTLSLPIINLQELPELESEAEVQKLLTQEASHNFNLTEGPLLRCTLLQLSEKEHVVMFTMHHIISDGWSMGVLVQEIAALYEAFSQNQASPLPELSIQYADFAVWQRQWLQGEILENLLTYWKQQLGGNLPILQLPTDRPRPAMQTFRGRRKSFSLSTKLTEALNTLSRNEDVTLFMTLLAAFKTLLHRYSGQEDILVGSPIANRNRNEIEQLIGFFVNTLVLRTDIDGNPSFRELLRRVREVTLGAYAHQDMPFDLLVEELQPQRDLSYTPLFQVMFVLQNAPKSEIELSGLTLSFLDNNSETAMFDLTLYMEETEEGLVGTFEYNTDLFEDNTICRMVGHLQTLLEGIVANPQARLSQLPLLTEPERQTLLVEWNNQKADYPQEQCIHQLFEAQVEWTPDAVAVVFEDVETQYVTSLTYRELNTRANQLAHYLRSAKLSCSDSLGVRPEVLVGICMERSLEMVIGLLGILKAGGAYVPLDPNYPQERLAFMLSDSQVPVLLTQQRLLEKLPEHKAQVICLDTDWNIIAQQSQNNPINISETDNLAYVIYTSGSTGQPKGVFGLHRGAINRFHWMWQNFPFAEREICCQKTSLNFVDSVWEIFGPLLQGIPTVIIPDQAVKDPQQFIATLARNYVTRLVLVPSLLRVFLNTYEFLQLQLPKLKLWISSGEALSKDLLGQFQQSLPDSTLLNLYGSSEVSADVTCYSFTPQNSLTTSVSIGRVIANTQIYILDSNRQPVPIGVPGEIYVGGEQLARGYLNNPELTIEKFIPNPFSDFELGNTQENLESSEIIELQNKSNNLKSKIQNPKWNRLYKTGDLARYLPDGNIEFLGRIDHQVKVRGFRIELGEIEAVISQHPAVQETVVVVSADEADSQRLVAYIAPHSEQTLRITELRHFLESKLPNYMQPTAFVMLETLPLTPNGKVDRQALSSVEATQLLSASDFIAPSTPIEEILAGIWTEVLGIEKIGIHDNFFELGGHSLIATRVISQIRQVFQVELPLRRLFEEPTVAGLAKDIDKSIKTGLGVESTNIERISRSQQLPLSFAQQRLWFLTQLEPNSPFYNIPAAVRLEGQLNLQALQQSFNEILRRHEALRTNFHTIEGQPLALISPVTSLELPIFDISELSANQRETQVQQLISAEAQQPFDLNSDLLLRVKLLRLSEQEHIVLLTMHHIASDGWSTGILVHELATLYQAFCDRPSGGCCGYEVTTAAAPPPAQNLEDFAPPPGARSSRQPSPLTELPIQYVDFAAWQRQWLQGEVLQSQISYWRKQLEDAPHRLELPTDHPRPAVGTLRSATYSFELSQELSVALNKLSQQQGCTLFMTLLAAFQTLLSHYTGSEDIVIGSAIANRNRAEIEGLIGFFVNTLVLRTNLAGNPTFKELLTRVRQMALGAYAHQDLPFEQLVEELQPQRDLSHTPLFQIMFVLQNAPMPALELPGLTLSFLPSQSGSSQFDLTLEMTETAQGIFGTLHYCTDLFEASTIIRMAGHLQTLLEGIVTNPELRLWELPLITEPERHTLLLDWNKTEAEYPQNQCIHQLFEATVERTPDAVAVVFEEEQITYRELNTRANQLAHHLRSAKLSRSDSLGVGPEVLVGLCTERSIEMIIGLLGILKAGAAYVPLDPAYPKERLALMLNDAQISVLVTQQHLVANLPTQTAKIVYLDDANWQVISSQNPVNQTSPANLAYVIYTSGSTGTPKGVTIEHQSLVNFVQAAITEYQIQAQDRILQFASISFDAAGEEIFPCLVQGATLVLRTEQMLASIPTFIQKCLILGISVLDIPTAFWQQLTSELSTEPVLKLPESLRLVIIGGEKALPVMVTNWQQQVQSRLRLVNSYGPTETTVVATVCDLGLSMGRCVPIGRAIANMQTYVLDAHLQPVAIGVPGELYIGGIGVARGYLHQPQLTASKFIPNPFSNSPGTRLYKTGDLVRYCGDGQIEFLGRVDNQVKIRGFRVELGEIEALLNQHPAVREAVVISRQDVSDYERLVAYVVANIKSDVGVEGQTSAGELNTQQASQWQAVFDNLYNEIDPQQHSGFYIKGWESSYTGLDIPDEEVREWMDQTIERISALQPTRVLEIGCGGSGLMLLRFAPHCTHYCATDISENALHILQQQLSKLGQDLPGVSFIQKGADDFTGMSTDAFDAVFIVSVAQYFPSVDYLLKVLEGAVNVVEPGGFIFLGDVRNKGLLEAFHTSVQLYKAPASLSVANLQQRVQKQIFAEKQLVIDPAFFIALKQHLPKISNVEIHLERGHFHNELTKFRYDVIIHVGNEVYPTVDISWLDWQQAKLTVPSVRQLLLETEPDILGIANVPNARVLADVQAVELLKNSEGLTNVGELRETLQAVATTGVDPEELWALSEELPYTVDISWSDSSVNGEYQVVFKRRTAASQMKAIALTPACTRKMTSSQSWSDYANAPLQEMSNTQLVSLLRQHLGSKLPNYMVPGAFVMLDALPLLPNGKVDRKALPAPNTTRPELEAAYQPPQTEVEKIIASIWQEILHVEDVGIHDNFFELGGHSLLLIQVHSKLQKVFQRDLTLVEMFQYPTISHLAKYFSQESSEETSFIRHSHHPESRTASVQRRKQVRKAHRSATKQKDISSQQGE